MMALFRASRRIGHAVRDRRTTTARPRWSSTSGEHLEGVFVFEIIDDQITNLYAMRNPDKLVGITVPRTISRS